MKLSARNILKGTVASVKKGAVNTEVVLNLKGGPSITSVITNTSADNLALKEGKEAFAMIKASSVIIGTDLDPAKVSARNILCGTITKVIEGPVSAEIDLDLGGGNTVTAVITEESAKKLGLKEGGKACAMIKASSVIMGVD
jgi:molybdate transport system regulatory protein